MMACVTGWFDTHRSLAVSLVSAGMGMAPMTMSPLAAWLVSTTTGGPRLQIVAASPLSLMIPVALLVRRPPALAPAVSAAADARAAIAACCRRRRCGRRNSSCWSLTNFFCCATHSGPIFHTVSYAVSCGIPLVAAVSIYSVEGLAGHGRPHRFRPPRRPLRRQARAGLGTARCRRSARWPISSSAISRAFYAVAAVFGFIYAGVMPLYAVLARENFPLRMMGTVIGGTAMAGSLGMATGRSREGSSTTPSRATAGSISAPGRSASAPS